jgi:hypothetical protein
LQTVRGHYLPANGFLFLIFKLFQMTNEKEFKAFYIVLTQNFRWGKSLNLKDAMKSAGLQSGSKKQIRFIYRIG